MGISKASCSALRLLADGTQLPPQYFHLPAQSLQRAQVKIRGMSAVAVTCTYEGCSTSADAQTGLLSFVHVRPGNAFHLQLHTTQCM